MTYQKSEERMKIKIYHSVSEGLEVKIPRPNKAKKMRKKVPVSLILMFVYPATRSIEEKEENDQEIQDSEV